MKGQRIVWEMPDGTIRVGKSFIDDHEAFARKVETDPGMTGARRLADMGDEDPPSRRWRDCWRNRGDGRIHVELTLARTQRLEEIRSERDRRLTALDGPWMRALGQGQTTEADAIETLRQRLRQIPDAIASGLDAAWNAAATAEALAAYEPAWPGRD